MTKRLTYILPIILFLCFLTMGVAFDDPGKTKVYGISPVKPAPEQAWSDWSNCQKAATAGVARAVAEWQSQAVLKDIVINGSNATGGSVTGPSLQLSIERTMTEARVPAVVANAFASSVANAWSIWTSSLHVPGLPWYPSFCCFPGPYAPPTPNVPTVLATLGGNPSMLSAFSLKMSIRNALGTFANDPKALTAIERFSNDFSARFTKYLASVKVSNVIGQGPVPAWLCSGIVCTGGQPVLNGKGIMKPGGFVGTWPAN
jgi:hypothetical protein